MLKSRIAPPILYALQRLQRSGWLSAGAGCSMEMVRLGLAEFRSKSWLIDPTPLAHGMAITIYGENTNE